MNSIETPKRDAGTEPSDAPHEPERVTFLLTIYSESSAENDAAFLRSMLPPDEHTARRRATRRK